MVVDHGTPSCPCWSWVCRAPSNLPGSQSIRYQPLHLDRERGLETPSLLCVETQICTLCLYTAAGSRGQWDISMEVQPRWKSPLIHCLVGFERGFGKPKAAFLCGTWPEAINLSNGFCLSSHGWLPHRSQSSPGCAPLLQLGESWGPVLSTQLPWPILR